MKATQLKMVDLNSENDKYNTEAHEKLRMKDMQIDKINEELKHVKSIQRSQETTISYFRKKVDELNKQLEDERAEKVTLQSEMRRIEHLSSKHSSPRYDEETKSERCINENFTTIADPNNRTQTEGTPKSNKLKENSFSGHLTSQSKTVKDSSTDLSSQAKIIA